MAKLDASVDIDIGLCVRELDSRTSGAMRVRLLWRPVDDRVFVSVVDGGTGQAFEIEVAPDMRALDVFNHPYAYTASDPADRTGAPKAPAAPTQPSWATSSLLVRRPTSPQQN